MGVVSFTVTFFCSCSIIAFIEFVNKKNVKLSGYLFLSLMTLLGNGMLSYNYGSSSYSSEDDTRRLIMAIVVMIKALLDIGLLFYFRKAFNYSYLENREPRKISSLSLIWGLYIKS